MINKFLFSGVVNRYNRSFKVVLLPQNKYIRNCHNQSRVWRRKTNIMKKRLPILYLNIDDHYIIIIPNTVNTIIIIIILILIN